MVRALLSFVIGAAAGAIMGFALAAVTIFAGHVLPPDRTWIATLCAGIGAFAGALVGLAAGVTHALADGKMSRTISAIGLGAIAGAAIPYLAGRIKPGWRLFFGACLGAFLAGAAIVIRARWNRPPAHPIADKWAGATDPPEL